MALNRAKKHRRIIGSPSRDSSATRRAALAPAAPLAVEGEEQALARLVGHTIEHLARRGRAGRTLADYRQRLRERGRGDLVTLTNSALLADGGAFARTIAKASTPEMRQAAAGAAVLLVRMMAEHRVSSASAVALLLRSALSGAIADCAMARIVAGEAGPNDAKIAGSMSTGARLDLLTSLQLQRQADDARSAPSWGNWPPQQSSPAEADPPADESDDAPPSDDREADDHEPAPMAIVSPGPASAPPDMSTERHREPVRGETDGSIWNSLGNAVASAVDPSPEVIARIDAAKARAEELHAELLRDKAKESRR